MRKKWEINRRQFITGLGASLALPMLDIMLPSVARAAAAGKNQKLVFIYLPNGIVTDTLAPPSYLLNAMADIKADSNFITGLTNYSDAVINGSHFAFWNPLLGGAPTAALSDNCDPAKQLKSFDQYIAPLNVGSKMETLAINAYPADSTYLYKPVLANNASWKGPNDYVPTYFKPLDAYNQLFSGNLPQPQVDQRLADQLKRKRSILHYCMDDIKKVRSLASKNDLIRLDEYFTGVNELDQRVLAQMSSTPMTTNSCQSPTGITTSNADSNYPAHLKMFYDIMFFALKCDMTRVVTFLHASENTTMGTGYVPNLNSNASWHAHSHYSTANYSDDGNNPSSSDPNANRIDYQNILIWHYARIVEFVKRLKAETTPTGNLLDETLVCWGSDIGYSDGHDRQNLFWTLAGSGNGAFNKGKTLTHTNRVPITNLWLSIMKGFGVSINQFGNSTGEISGLRI